MNDSLLNEYKSTYSYKALLEKYSLTEKGVWKVKGEDPNCDLGGPHYQPTLGYFTGVLEDVIEYAVTMHGFWTWGGGGDFEKIDIKSLRR